MARCVSYQGHTTFLLRQSGFERRHKRRWEGRILAAGEDRASGIVGRPSACDLPLARASTSCRVDGARLLHLPTFPASVACHSSSKDFQTMCPLSPPWCPSAACGIRRFQMPSKCLTAPNLQCLFIATALQAAQSTRKCTRQAKARIVGIEMLVADEAWSGRGRRTACLGFGKLSRRLRSRT